MVRSTLQKNKGDRVLMVVREEYCDQVVFELRPEGDGERHVGWHLGEDLSRQCTGTRKP